MPPPPYISLLYIIYHISLLHPRWDEQCRDTMMTVPPQLTSSLPSFSYPASFRHPPPASSMSYYVHTSIICLSVCGYLNIYIYTYDFINEIYYIYINDIVFFTFHPQRFPPDILHEPLPGSKQPGSTV